MNPDILAARAVALDLLQSVLRRRVPLDDALEQNRALADLDARDRGFARLLAATVLRRLGQIDDIILSLLDRPDLPKAGVLDILRLSAAQLLFLGTPSHAAVDTGVELAVARGLAGMKGLINAVLRRLAREGADRVAAQDAGRLNTPDWLWLSWRKAYGTGHTRAIVDAHLNEAPLDISVKVAGEVDHWAQALGGTALAGLGLPGGTVRRPAGGAVPELLGFADGAWWVQDAAAALPARLLLSGALGEVEGRRIIDLCAAPGGKTAQLAAAGAQVLAVDRSAPRLQRLQRNMARLGLTADVAVGDATRWMPESPVDAVLLDAPCSATGTIRRHPDVARLKQPDDVERLSAVQARLLNRAVDMVRPGGLVVYCTCSLQPEEGEEQVAALLARRDDVVREPVAVEELRLSADAGLASPLTVNGDVRATPGLWAERGGLDGFYAARLRRKA